MASRLPAAHAALVEILRNEYFADDLDPPAAARDWHADELRRWFEEGGPADFDRGGAKPVTPAHATSKAPARVAHAPVAKNGAPAKNGHGAPAASPLDNLDGLFKLWAAFPQATENSLQEALQVSSGDVDAAANYLLSDAHATAASMGNALASAQPQPAGQARGGDGALVPGARAAPGPYRAHAGAPSKYVLLAKARVHEGEEEASALLCELERGSLVEVAKEAAAVAAQHSRTAQQSVA
jgi:hypothetical protein